MKKKVPMWLLVISILSSVWFYYEWQQTERLYVWNFVSVLDETTISQDYIQHLGTADFPTEQRLLGTSLEEASHAFASASSMYHPDIELPFDQDEFSHLSLVHIVFEREYLPVVEKLIYTNQSPSSADEDKIQELTSNLRESGLISGFEYMSDLELYEQSDLYMKSVEKFLRLEGMLPPEGEAGP